MMTSPITVAVTGMGAVTPLGCGTEIFWENLKKGINGIGEITGFDTAGLKVNIAGQVKDFDPNLYMDARTVRRTDRFTQYAIAAAAMAMSDSGLVDFEDGLKGPLKINGLVPERTGVYVGSGIGGMDTFIRETIKLEQKGSGLVSPLFIPMMIANIAAGMLAIQYQAKGPNLPVVTACATGSHAIGEAFHAIKSGRADVIIAGGCEATINELAISGFANAMALSKSKDPGTASLPFDKRREGFVIAEGAGILVLENLENALRREAKIYGLLTGYGNTCDAYHITAPHPQAEGAAAAIKLAMNMALNHDPSLMKKMAEEPMLYINAHGTGTPLNDAAETLALKKALGEKLAYRAAVSSTKSMTGHMLGAAGAAEALVSLLAIRDGIIPPTIGYEEADPDCDLDYTPLKARSFRPDLVLSNSLGFGGHNACLAFVPYHE